MSNGHFCSSIGRMDIYECPMDISVRPMVEWTLVYVQWTLLTFNTKYNAGNAFCLLKAVVN